MEINTKVNHLRLFLHCSLGEVVKNQIREGKGRYTCGDKDKKSNYEYEGDWQGNLRNGIGRCFYYNGDLFVGQW